MIAGARVLVVGLGRSGTAAAAALLRGGAAVTAVDARDDATVAAAARDLRETGATVTLGAAADAAGGDCDVVVASPGVAADAPVLATALRRGVPVWSEPELGWRLAAGRCRIVAVTGTNGKTTTTELVAACLGVPAAGNIGTPLVELLAAPVPPPLVVAELSSFQLRFADTLRADVAVLLNVAPDHLDWHGSLDAYAAAKARIWATQRPTDTAVVNADDPGAGDVVTTYPPPGRRIAFTVGRPRAGEVGIVDGAVVAADDSHATEAIVAVGDLALRGAHNLANVCAAAAAALAAGAAPSTLAAPLSAHRSGRHRLEAVATVGGVSYVNDSKATNPHAAAAALATFDSVVWIAGGLAKGLRFDSLRDVVADRVRAAVTIGSAGPAIARLARAAGVAVVEAHTLDRAVPAAADLARPGDTVLLAPACASMDQFRDYAERGRVFRDAVAALPGATPHAAGPRAAEEVAGGR